MTCYVNLFSHEKQFSQLNEYLGRNYLKSNSVEY